MLMIERGDEPDVPRLQHAVAEHVAGHVADTRRRKILILDVDADLAEVALYAFPGAARGDGHFFMVIAGRTAGGERITQPESIFR